MKCFEAESMLEKYLRGDLGDKEAERLEEHLLTCENCSEHLEDLTLLRASLGSHRASPSEAQPSERFEWRWVWLAAAAAVLLAVIFWPRSTGPDRETQVLLAHLAEVQPPPYEPKSLRASADEAERASREAMVAYQEGRFEEAVAGLETAVGLDPNLNKAQFYLGASYLLTGQAPEAIDSLTRVVESGDATYSEWALFYRGKAHLRLGDVESALADMQAVSQIDGDLAPQAKEVVEELQD